MRIGVIFPQIDIGPEPARVRAYATAVEELGFDHITCFDQVVGLDMTSRPGLRYVHDHRDLFHEVFVVLGFIAAITSRIGLATGVLVLPQRQTALVAKQAAEVDVLCGGRLRLGIGVGVKPDEFGALGETFADRGRRSEEQMAVLRALWTRELVTYEGRWHRIIAGGINPLPVQRPIPLWIGGHSEPVLRRIARLADGWMPNFEPDEFGQSVVERLRGYAREAGRDPTSIGIEATVNVLGRDPEQWVEEALAWQRLGATHLSANTLREVWSKERLTWSKAEGAPLGPDEHIEALRRYREVVAAALPSS